MFNKNYEIADLTNVFWGVIVAPFLDFWYSCFYTYGIGMSGFGFMVVDFVIVGFVDFEASGSLDLGTEFLDVCVCTEVSDKFLSCFMISSWIWHFLDVRALRK